MPRQTYKKKSSLSLKQFISEFGEGFSEHMKKRLMDLESRSFMTRKDFSNRFDIKHVEHLQYNCSEDMTEGLSKNTKEYSYAQLEVNEGFLYFSESCLEDKIVKQSPMVAKIYKSLSNEQMIISNGSNLKKIDDNNIDFIIDKILASCPEVSKEYLKIIQEMAQRSKNKIK